MDGLVIFGDNDTLIPGIAENRDISEDGLTYSFHLREGATWTNGNAVTAEVFIFAWHLLFSPETKAIYASTWAPYIAGAEDMLAGGTLAQGIGYQALDKYTLEVHLSQPCAYFLNILTFPNFYPINETAYNEGGGLEGYGTEANLICTNDPFAIESREHSSEIV